MKVLVVGSGGREHALVWKIAQSDQVKEVIFTPGNGGADFPLDVYSKKIYSFSFGTELRPPFKNLLHFIEEKKINLVVIGSESFLEQGISDAIEAIGVPCFGPKKNAALLETSKSFAKEIMKSAGVATPDYNIFHFDQWDQAKKYLETHAHPLVLKADGICAGKGVFLSPDQENSLKVLDVFFRDRTFGSAANKILIEKFIDGEEVSILAFTDGENVFLLPPLQDHKRLNEKDLGPNTGGMGVYSHPSFVTDQHLGQIKKDFFLPVLQEMKKRGVIYRGLLYAGLIFSKIEKRFYVLEFNVRFGDPECQCVLPLLESDLFTLLFSCAKGDLSKADFRFSSSRAVNVVLASGGYPNHFEKGYVIDGLKNVKSSHVFHAGTQFLNNQFITTGGRVLSLTALGACIDEACEKVYQDIEKIHFEDCYYRKDIAHRERNREK